MKFEAIVLALLSIISDPNLQQLWLLSNDVLYVLLPAFLSYSLLLSDGIATLLQCCSAFLGAGCVSR